MNEHQSTCSMLKVKKSDYGHLKLKMWTGKKKKEHVGSLKIKHEEQ